MDYIDHGWASLKPYGIFYVTGEACGLGMRIKCDLDEGGHKLISEFFGNSLATNELIHALDGKLFGRSDRPVSHDGPEGWKWCSVMLPRSIFSDLCVYCLLQDHEVAVIAASSGSDRGWIGGCSLKEWSTLQSRIMSHWRVEVYQKSTAPGNGFRNQHMWTGEVQP